jgi:hypothetical protein
MNVMSSCILGFYTIPTCDIPISDVLTFKNPLTYSIVINYNYKEIQVQKKKHVSSLMCHFKH